WGAAAAAHLIKIRDEVKAWPYLVGAHADPSRRARAGRLGTRRALIMGAPEPTEWRFYINLPSESCTP
ncbi:MAG TPA: hypothetical protein VFJ82_01255, partial [Longimicrobium sp.]|nr:hypothetical protein [Longimicrobium sp.]